MTDGNVGIGTSTPYIGIDPGKSGGIAVICGDEINAAKCPEKPLEMSVLFEIMSPYDKTPKICIEHVWGFPSDSSKTAFTFGHNFGCWHTIIECSEFDYQFVSPRAWQTFFETPKLVKKERKRWLKDLASNIADNKFRVTFNTSDAILIAKYCKDNFEKNELK